MITLASFPAELDTWDQDEHPFCLEVFGESEPLLDMSHAEVIPAGRSDAVTSTPTPIYEYWWTLGHGGTKPEHRHLSEGRARDMLWDRLDEIAARVYLYFPVSGGWRTHEILASTKYLSPVMHQADWTEKAAADWQRMQPIIDGAGHVASMLGVVPGVGTVAAGMAPVLSAVSKLEVGNVPQGVKGFEWYVERITVAATAGHGVMHGVVWAIPKDMFELLGGRLSGSLALSLVPTASTDPNSAWRPLTLPMLGQAVVYADGDCRWVPAHDQFVELPLSPKMASRSASQ